MGAAPIDYDALAQQHGGTPAVNYDALAAQHGGTAQPSPTTAAAPEGFWHSLGATFGVTPEAAQAALQNDKDHPIKAAIMAALGPAGAAGKMLYDQAAQSGGHLSQAVKDYRGGNTAQAALDTIQAVPIVGPGMVKATNQYANGDTGGAAGTLIGTAAQAAPTVAGAADQIAPDRPLIPNPSLPNLKSKFYPTSQSLVSDVSAARNLAKALVVTPQAAPNFIRAATDEAGTVVDFARKNNLPINSKVDFANAAKATADEVQSHFQDNILGPNSGEITSVPPNYRGNKLNVEGTRATLGEVNNRINAINQELNPNYRKALPSQTNAANISDADLLAEKGALTNILHNKLATATGLQPSEVAAVRQQAGKLRTLADEAQLSANTDTYAAGRQGMGAVTTSSIGTKAGIIDRTLQAAQGGPEVIGNRQVLSALKKVTPKPLNLPNPNPLPTQ